MRRQGSSVIIYLLFGLLIVIFVIQGPGTPGGDRGCGSASAEDTALTIYGDKVRVPTDYRAMFSYLKGNIVEDDRQAKVMAFETLIRRELLAQEAERRGFVVEKEMVDREILRGYIFLGGQRLDMRQAFFEKIDDEYVFDHKRRFMQFVYGLNLRSSSTFVDMQKRELQAALMAESLRSQVVVSRDEALSAFLHEGNTATYDVVGFSSAVYRNALLVTEQDVATYAASHGAEIEAKYKADQALYKGVKDQLRVREIFVAKATAAPAAPAAAPTAPAAAPAAPAAAPAAPAEAATTDAAKAKLEAARADIVAGKRKFEDVAKELSSEATARAMAGDLGWRTKEFPGLSEPALNAAVKALEVGKVSEVIVTSRGVHLLIVQDTRKGDLTLDQVKAEIALELAKDAWAKEAARQAAVAALEAAQRSVVKKLDELYKDPNAPKTGALEWESENVPAAWAEETQDDPAAAATGGAAPAAAGAAAPAAAGGAAPAAAGGAAPAAAGGAAPAAAPAPAAEVDLLKLPALPLPALSPVEPPVVRRVGPTPRLERLPDLGSSKAAAKAVFDQLAAGELANTIYEANGDYVLVQLIERNTPKMEDFDKDADRRIRMLRDARAQTMVEEWLEAACHAAVKAKKLKHNAAITRELDEKTGKARPDYYTPCSSFR